MLNMLIAIMSDTYERNSENRAVHAMKTKLELMGEYAFVHQNRKTKKERDHFLYVVLPGGEQTLSHL